MPLSVSFPHGDHCLDFCHHGWVLPVFWAAVNGRHSVPPFCLFTLHCLSQMHSNYISSLSLFISIEYFIYCIFLHSTVHRHLGCFQVRTIGNKAARNILVHFILCTWPLISLGCSPRSRLKNAHFDQFIFTFGYIPGFSQGKINANTE